MRNKKKKFSFLISKRTFLFSFYQLKVRLIIITVCGHLSRQYCCHLTVSQTFTSCFSRTNESLARPSLRNSPCGPCSVNENIMMTNQRERERNFFFLLFIEKIKNLQFRPQRHDDCPRFPSRPTHISSRRNITRNV